MASKNPQIRAIEQEAKRLSLADDGKSSHKERFALRAQLREEAGLAKEQKKRGGAAGFYDRNKAYIAPVAAGLAGLATGGLLAPVAIGALQGFDRPGQGGIGYDVGAGLKGAAIGGLAGGVGQFAGGLLPGGAAAGGAVPAGAAAGGAMAPVPAVAGGGGGVLGTLGGIAGKASDFLNSKTGQTLTGLASAGYGIAQQNKANKLTGQAVAADQARWKAGQPLRDAGMAGMLQPVPANTTATLGDAGRRGNPFAPVPAMGGR